MKNLLFGAVYILEQDYSDAEIENDLRNMKEGGCDLITLWPVANAWLAPDAHTWVFDATKRALDLCQKLGMKALLQLIGQNQAQEYMPDTMMTEDMFIKDEDGDAVNRNCYWANLNHPAVRDMIDHYFRAALSALKDHPAVYGWDIFNEAHFKGDDKYTVQKYQLWLEQQYGTIERLNYLWYRRYDSFAQITPAKRRTSYSIWSSLLPDVMYEKFRSENLAEICKFLYDTAKKYDAVHPIVIDGASAEITSADVTGRNNDEFLTSMVPDVYGSTFYPKSWGRDYRHQPWMLSMYFSIPASAAKKAGKSYFVDEIQTHTQSVLTPGSEVEPDELEKWIWMNVFVGCRGIQLWRWRPFLHGYQATGRGLTKMDGTPNDRAYKVKQFVDSLDRNAAVFAQACPASPLVKIAYSYENRLFFDSLLKWKNSFWAWELTGWYKAFWHLGQNPEVTDVEDLSEDDLKTPILVLPALLSISEKAARRLERYVADGGILIADARMGALNEYGEVPKTGIPGPVLSSVFGILEEDVESGKKFCMQDHTDEAIDAYFMDQKLALSDTVSVLGKMQDGSPAVTLNRYKKGQAIYFNSFIGAQMSRQMPDSVTELLREMLGKIEDAVLIEKSDHIHTAVMETQSQKLVLIINFGNEDETIRIRDLGQAGKPIDILTGEEVRITENAAIRVPANATFVLKTS